MEKIRNQISTFWPIDFDFLQMTSMTLKMTLIKIYLSILNLENMVETCLTGYLIAKSDK